MYFKCLAENKQWIVDINNFNNIFKASLTLFVVGSLDGWSAIMYTAANSDVESKVNYINNSIIYIFIY